MTCRKSILYDKRTSSIFTEKDNIIEIDDDQHKLGRCEKMQILKKHMPNDMLSKKQIEEILQVNTYFLLLCKISAQMEDKSFVKLKRNFANQIKLFRTKLKSTSSTTNKSNVL